ncbi:receptor-type tyrosine-protein kinase FLT3 isoform X2 [Takifugu flavidus]|uniref:receptor-type tyrosine-protein kinase FLT3 isoform X2 n=1 Tax=Takifugu flavidus TaxID=433684 RepID=UPI0025449D60|nr:receptor-type tyrosine-protein kinase FLT3 isoform X2 [Takifugu flavidus]
MIAAVLLLCVCCTAAAKTSQLCVPSQKVACFVPADDLSPSAPVRVDVCLGKTLNISLEKLSGNPACSWTREAEPIHAVNGSRLLVLPALSEANSGEYELTCETGNGVRSSVSVSLRVVKSRPTTPRLLLSQFNEQNSSPYFLCTSGGCPEPTLGFSGGYSGSEKSSSAFFNRGAMCCAENAAGQECTQLYDYDLERMQEDELSNITVQPDQSLLLRCRKKAYYGPYPKWDKGGLEMDENKLACHSDSQELCIKTDHHSNSRMTYLFIKSVNVSHSGTYTCRDDNRNKNVYVNVQAEGFLSVELEKSKIVSANDVSDTCLEARVSYHPVLRRCSWEAPNKMVTECIRQTWVTKHSTVKLCNPLQAGDYKLLLEAGGREETRTVSVCVADTPMFTFGTGIDIMVETSSLVPANYTWMSCVSANDSICELDSSWTVIPDTSVTVTDFSCKKEILSSPNRTWVKGHHYRFCLTNSVGSWCKSPQFHPQLLRVSSVSPDENFNLLKVSSLLLLVALVVVSVTLFYFIKKKKPKYQPQLQMIQMVGPSDNDYIYINFKDFEYDTKWEFPRENLELGKELGSGAFGMVVQATAYGISKPGVPQQVAVKMLKEKHHSVEKEALVSELKMLTHIGSHDNIVNLLGACTESGPTYLIFQYCCHGDLLNYLKKNRELYHKSVTDAFNKDRFSSLYQNLETKPGGQDNIAILTLGSDNGNNFEGENRSIGITMSASRWSKLSSSADPEIVEELEDERPEDLQTLTFDDLLSFAFQVAKGMEFLSSKNCIHRDLAARNILVTKDRLVKIGDFGLARDIENDSNYVVRGNVRLPVKWMAPESTFQGIYTTKSDVWAYGILLWEVFSLGVTPYPGIKVDHNFYSMIERGFKMECPYYASDSVYGMMCKCWALNPGSRPSFSELVSFMCNQLTDREEKLYHNILEQKECVHTNAAATKATSALETQNQNKAANEYSQPRSATESKELETSAEEEKLLKPDAQ